MRWDDERYVRFYTRDTPEFLALSWQARGLLGLLMRKVDRAGILMVGKLGLRGVAVAVGGPWVEIEGPLGELLADGCAVHDEARGAVVIPNFLEAQEAKQNDAARKRKSREVARAVFGGTADASEKARRVLGTVTECDGKESRGVTESHTESREVTAGHAESHAVTPSRAVPSLAVPNQTPKAPKGAGVRPSKRDAPPELRAQAAEVLEHWASQPYHSKRPVTDHPERRWRVSQRLAEGSTVEDLKAAVEGAALDDWLMGRRDGSPGYKGVETILRDVGQVERLAALGRSKSRSPPAALDENDPVLRRYNRPPAPLPPPSRNL